LTPPDAAASFCSFKEATVTLTRISAIGVLASVVLFAGCASRRTQTDAAREGVFFEKGAVILTGSALTDGPGTVLAAMSGKVPNFRVQQRAGRCPEITLRNSVSFQSVDVSPHVYVDGTRSTDTCILETLRVDDVERVEVYPQGFTTRPGYGTNAHGLILVFMRTG
jgi:hypothetical protein